MEGKIEGCQPLTIVGVSIYMLNQRLGIPGLGQSEDGYKDCKKIDHEIADVVEKGI